MESQVLWLTIGAGGGSCTQAGVELFRKRLELGRNGLLMMMLRYSHPTNS